MTDHPSALVSVPPHALEAIAFNLCSLHDFDPVFVQQNERFAKAAITEYLRATPAPAAPQAAGVGERVYIDCEFDGHNGPLLSVALVREGGDSIHIRTDVEPMDLWVRQNVLPLMDSHKAERSEKVYAYEVGGVIRSFLGEGSPVIVCDSPQDARYFSQALTTAPDGGYAPFPFDGLTIEVLGVDAYPTTIEGAVQHNAWWDAMALREALRAPSREPEGGAVDDLVDRFAAALKEKLHAAEAKHGHGDAWMHDDWRDDLVYALCEHIEKGDPRDVAAYCAFAWHHGWSLALATREEAPDWTARTEAAWAENNSEGAPAEAGEDFTEGAKIPDGAISGTDDGQTVWLESSTGGAHRLGTWGGLSLRFTEADGSSVVRDYEDVNLRAQPQAREDAQLVGPVFFTGSENPEDRWIAQKYPDGSCSISERNPAPDAQRVAVEALGQVLAAVDEPAPKPLPEQPSRAAEAMAGKADDEARSRWEKRVYAAKNDLVFKVRQALAALQAEQGAK